MTDSITVLTAFLIFCAACVAELWWNARKEKSARKELRRQSDVWRLILRDIDDQQKGIVPLVVADKHQNK